MTTEDEHFESWLHRLQGIYEYSKAGVLRQLNGQRVKGWNDEGLHVWSHLWGGLDATTPPWLSDAMAEAPAQLRIGPKLIENVAYADALDEFADRLLRAHAGRRA